LKQKCNRLSLYAFKLILTNIQSEIIDKSAIISTRRWTNSLGTAHSRTGGPTFVNEKVVYIVEKKLAVNFETKDGDFCYMHLKSIVQIFNLRSLTEVLDLSGSPLAKDLQVKLGFRPHCRNNREPERCLTRIGVQKIINNLGAWLPGHVYIVYQILIISSPWIT